MLDTTVQINLVGCAQRFQNILGFMTFLCGEYEIGFGCGNRDRARESFEFIDINE
jgi:hypothetical protein